MKYWVAPMLLVDSYFLYPNIKGRQRSSVWIKAHDTSFDFHSCVCEWKIWLENKEWNLITQIYHHNHLKLGNKKSKFEVFHSWKRINNVMLRVYGKISLRGRYQRSSLRIRKTSSPQSHLDTAKIKIQEYFREQKEKFPQELK